MVLHMKNLSFSKQSPNRPTIGLINLQRKKLHETRKLQRALKQECARNEAIIAQLRSMLSDAPAADMMPSGGETGANVIQKTPNFSFLTSDPAAKQLKVNHNAGTRHNPLTTNTNFILSQLPALRAMLNQLRPKLSTLPRSTDEMAPESINDERRDYIESRVKNHLERAGELAMSDSNTVITGRKIGTIEAQALEVVAGMLVGEEVS
jgi:kinetochore protein Mis12/MTW1